MGITRHESNQERDPASAAAGLLPFVSRCAWRGGSNLGRLATARRGPSLGVLATLWVVLLGSASRADTIHVPWDAPTIQAGVDQARPGDVVEVADGVFTGPGNRDVDLLGKAITVRSLSGPQHCTIDCQGQARAFVVRSGEGPQTVIEGFTVIGGQSHQGWGSGEAVLVTDASPVIRGCVFANNGFHYDGKDFGPRGGALYLGMSAARIEDCVFEDNWAEYGGAIYAFQSSPQLVRCVFRRNKAWATIHFFASFHEGDGGAVYLYGCNGVSVVDCVFDENESIDRGGAMCIRASILSSSGEIESCTFVRNWAFGDDGESDPGEVLSFWAESNESLSWKLTHSIVQHTVSPLPLIEAQGAHAELGVRFCDVLGGWPGNTNFDADPLLVDMDGGDYGLLPGSPCIDAGSSLFPIERSFTDVAGAPRLSDGDLDGELVVDVGAREFSHVTATLSGYPSPGNPMTLTLDGTPGMIWGVLLGRDEPGPPPLVPGLGYLLGALPLGWNPILGPGTLPDAITFTIPIHTPLGLQVLLLPVAVTPGSLAGSFGAPVPLLVHHVMIP